MDETDQPEHDNKGGEKCRIESSEELCAEFDLPVVVIFFYFVVLITTLYHLEYNLSHLSLE